MLRDFFVRNPLPSWDESLGGSPDGERRLLADRLRPVALRARLLIVDDHPLVLDGLRELFARELDVEVVAEATSGAAAVELASELALDVAVVDLSLPDMPGDEVIRRIAAVSGAPVILAHTMHEEPAFLRAAIDAGARGYVVKGAPREELVSAVRAVLSGSGFVSPAVAPALMDLARTVPPSGALAGLDDTDRAILAGTACGEDTAAIAARLGMSERAVDGARVRLRERLGVPRDADLVRIAIRAGLVDDE